MSIASEITRLQTAKDNIKSAIEAAGVAVPSDASIDTYHEYINQIDIGGGGIEIDPFPEDSTKYTYYRRVKSGDTQVRKANKYTFSTGLELPIEWVKTVDGDELSNGTYQLYNPGGQFINAEFIISESDTGKVLTFNYLNTADSGLPMCVLSNGTYSGKRIYICIDVDRAKFCTNNYGEMYLYAYTTGTITTGTDKGYKTGSASMMHLNLDPTTFGGYLLNNIKSVNTDNNFAYFTIVCIE